MSAVQGRIDNALSSAAGNTARITLANYSLDTTNGNTITINTWIYCSDNTTAVQAIVQNASNNWNGSTGELWGFTIQRNTSDSLYIRRCDNVSTGHGVNLNIDGFFNQYIRKWIMITVVFKGGVGNGYIKVYRNGEIFSTSLSLNLYIGASINMNKIIGVQYRGGVYSLPFLGSIDETFIVNFEMNAQQIKDLYMKGLGIF
jgi:hypothetical protein